MAIPTDLFFCSEEQVWIVSAVWIVAISADTLLEGIVNIILL